MASIKAKVFCLLYLSGLGVALLSGCQPSSPVVNRPVCDRVDISEEEIGKVLQELFAKMQDSFGTVPSEPILKDYAALIKQSLYHNGWCRLQKLRINGIVCDVQVYFVMKQPGEIHAELFRGPGLPSQYHVVKYYETVLTAADAG